MHQIIFVAFLLVSSSFFAQQENCMFVFSGQVVDIHDNTSVPYAKLQLKELNLNVTADSAGIFTFPPICAGSYSFTCIHHFGCEPVKFQRTIESNSFENIFIEFHFEELETVEVTQTIFKMSTLAIDRPSEIDQKYAAGKTLGDLVKQIPGVSTLNTGSNISKPVIHGMHSNRVLILNNGIRQEGQQWGSEHAPEIDPFLSTDVSLVKGASAVRYGSDAIAGVILLAPKALNYKAGVRGEMFTTAFSNGRQGSISALLEGGFNKIQGFSWRTQGTLKQGGTLQTPNYFLKNTAMKEYNFSLATKYERNRWGAEVFYSQFNTSLGIFSGSHIGNLTDLNNAFQAAKPVEVGSFTYSIEKPRQEIKHELLKVGFHYRLNLKNRIVFNFGRQSNLRKEYDRHTPYNDSLAALNLPAFQLSLITYSADLKWEHQWFKNSKGEAGLSYIKQGNSYQGRFFIPNFRKNSYGAYLLEIWKLKNFEIEAGVRADRTEIDVYQYESKVLQHYRHNFQQLSGSVGISRAIGHHLVLRANVGNAWRPPSINEMYSNGLHHGAAAIEIGNRNMKQEVSYSFQAGMTYRSRKITFQTDVYHNQIDGFIYLKPTLPPVLTIKGAFPVFRYQQINARFSGIDLFLNYRINQAISFSIKGAMVRAFNQSQKSFLVGIPADRIEPGITYNRTFSKARQLTFNVNVPIVRKQNRVEANSDYVDSPKGFALVNAQVSFGFYVRKQQLDLTLEVNNALNQTYRDYMNRFRYFADETGRNVGLKLKIPFNIIKYEK